MRDCYAGICNGVVIRQVADLAGLGQGIVRVTYVAAVAGDASGTHGRTARGWNSAFRSNVYQMTPVSGVGRFISITRRIPTRDQILSNAYGVDASLTQLLR
jgi:hypothetical protein